MAPSSLRSPSGYPLVGNTIEWARDPFAFIDRVVDEIGDVAQFETIGGDVCLLAHPEYAERMLVSDREAFGKTSDFTAAFGDGLLAAEGDQWTRLRSALDEFFYPDRIRSYTDTMVELTQRRIDRWEDGETYSLADEMKELALENIFATLFDTRLGIDENTDIRTAANELNGWFTPTSWALPDNIPTPARYRFRRAVERLQSKAESLLSAADTENSTDMLSALASMQETADLSDDEILSQVQTFIFAGHDTTGLALTYALHLLSTHAAVRDQFYTELDTVLGSSQPTLSTVGDLEVVERVLQEALRLYPSIHTIPRVTTTDVTMGGYRIPAGTETHLSVWRLGRDDRFWETPTEFRPARWAETTPQSEGYAYIPFGAGPRQCIGRRFALLEAKIVLATIGQQYRLEPQSELSVEPQMTTQPADDVPVTVRTR